MEIQASVEAFEYVDNKGINRGLWGLEIIKTENGRTHIIEIKRPYAFSKREWINFMKHGGTLSDGPYGLRSAGNFLEIWGKHSYDKIDLCLIDYELKIILDVVINGKYIFAT